MTKPDQLEINHIAQPQGDQVLASLCAQDPLGRSQYGRLPENDFDREWIAVFQLLRDGQPVGGVRLEAARLFTLLPEASDPWQHYRFGALVEFPLVTDGDTETRRESALNLLARVMHHANEFCPGMPLFCVLRHSDRGPEAVLRTCGFERLTDVCIDRKLLSERGLPADAAPALVYRFTPLAESPFDPLGLLTDKDEHLRTFSNEETKIRLVPTREFWSAVKAYTTFSAYPLIRAFLRKVLRVAADEGIDLGPSPRVLVAPCAAGDFLRFWPPEQPIASALAVDIRDDCRDLAKRRVESPQIDQLNLALCHALAVIVEENRVSPDVLDAFAQMVDRLRTTIDGGTLRINLATEAALRLFARSFDEVLLNHAVPDWYFPIKVLAGSLGLRESIDSTGLAPWLATHSDALKDAKALSERLLSAAAEPAFRDASLPGMESDVCTFAYADLTQSETLPDGEFDLALCWEFIHVFHEQAKIDQFLELLTRRVRKGGAILITCIRETEPTPPEKIQEFHWALEFFQRKGLACQVLEEHFAEDEAPFKKRLAYYYPAVIVTR